MQSSLVLHCGAREVSIHDLPAVAPPPTRTWHPVPHRRFLDTCLGTLDAAGYQIAKMSLGLTPDGHRLFGVLDLTTTLTEGVALAVGIRNSTNKTFPLGLTAGSRVFVCDNLAFRSEILVARKHSRFGEMRFNNAIASAVTSLRSFQDVEADRIRRMQETPVGDEGASLLFITAMERGIISYTALPKLWREWKEPSHDFGPPTLWRLFNAFTTVLGPRAKTRPNEYAGQTIRLNRLLLEDHRNGQEESN